MDGVNGVTGANSAAPQQQAGASDAELEGAVGELIVAGSVPIMAMQFNMLLSLMKDSAKPPQQ